ncbi:hypothetical protein LLG88_13705 [bacterium]|nr:hypothetical protein [bacterium]
MKALELITDTLDEIGCHGGGQQVSDSDAYKVLRRFNSMLDAWRTQELTIYNYTRTLFTFVANQDGYTVGPSSVTPAPNFVTPTRPVFIDKVAVQFPGTVTPFERELDPYTKAQWQEERMKLLPNTFPRRFYYNADAAVGTLYFWPVPTDVTIRPVLYLPAPLGSVPSLVTELTLPPGYEKAIRLNLAVECCRPFGRPVDGQLKQDAADALADIKRSNIHSEPVRVDVALLNRPDRFDIFTGD